MVFYPFTPVKYPMWAGTMRTGKRSHREDARLISRPVMLPPWQMTTPSAPSVGTSKCAVMKKEQFFMLTVAISGMWTFSGK